MIKAEDIYLKCPISFQKILFNISAHKKINRNYKRFPFKAAGTEKSQFYSFPDLQALQLEKLKFMINHAYNDVPYYRSVFDEKS